MIRGGSAGTRAALDAVVTPSPDLLGAFGLADEGPAVEAPARGAQRNLGDSYRR